MRRFALALVLIGCTRGALTHADLASAPPATATTRVPTTTPDAKPTGPIMVPPKPLPAEVELSGRVTVPRAAKGNVMVYVTDRACWQEGARAFGQTRIADTANGRFFVEIFVPQGTSIWVCSAVVDGKKPIVFHGELKRAPLLGKGLGEVVFADLAIAIARGSPVSVPPPQGSTED